MNRVLWLFFVLMSIKGLTQVTIRDKLSGKVSCDTSNLEGIYIVNLKTEKAVITGVEGDFSIVAAPGDTLLFAGSQFEKVRIVLNQQNFESEYLVVQMTPIVNQLKEVFVRRFVSINAVALGIIAKGQKTYTASERKLYTATHLNAVGNTDGTTGGSVSADPLFNFLSGRTAMLKKEVEVEKKESYLKQLDKLFDSHYFVNRLKIPSQYVKGFEYFAVENSKFTKVLDLKNKITIEFLLGELANQYNEIISNEK